MDRIRTEAKPGNHSTDDPAGRIIVGYDGSDTSKEALDWAATYADQHHQPLTVMHALDFLDMIPLTAGRSPLPGLDDAASAVAHEGVNRVRTATTSIDLTAATTTMGSVAAGLVWYSQTAALLVVGTRGHGRLAGAWLGSVAFAVSAHAACPVVVIRGDATRQPGPNRPVIVGVDGSPDSDAAVRFAAQAAATAQAPLIVITAYTSWGPLVWGPATPHAVPSQGGPPFSTIAEADAGAVAQASAAVAVETQPGLQVHQQIAEGPVPYVLATAAALCGLLVVGSRGRGGFAGLILGSTSHAMINLAPCPVAVLRAPAG